MAQKNYPTATIDEIREFANKNGRSFVSVMGKVHKLGLKKLKIFTKKLLKSEEGEKLKEVIDLEKFGKKFVIGENWAVKLKPPKASEINGAIPTDVIMFKKENQHTILKGHSLESAF
jgi:hypothetical protein